VLVIDNEAEHGPLLKQLLGHIHGVEVICATTGRDALEYLAETDGLECVAVLADLNLAGEQGTTLLDDVRSLYPHLLRALMTGWATPEVARAREDGVVEFLLEKPWSTETLAIFVAWVRMHAREPS